MKKQKVYVLMVSKTFPAYHPRAGAETYFRNKILLTVNKPEEKFEIDGKNYFLDRNAYDAETAFKAGWSPKITTIRENYDLWARRAQKINAGEAILSLRQWSGVPYRSNQVEFLRLEKIHVQRAKISRLAIDGRHLVVHTSVDGKLIDIDKVAKNDGLSVDDFCKWFKKDVEGVCIHFTTFLYGTETN